MGVLYLRNIAGILSCALSVVPVLGMDIDGDGLPDDFELRYTDPTSATALNPGDDLELGGAGDGLTNLEEYLAGTNPLNEDTDNDTLFDGEEIAGTDFVPPTNPLKSDTDGDGLSDGVETNTGIFISIRNTGTSPIRADTDFDGFTDKEEADAGTDPSRDTSAPSFLLRYWKLDGDLTDELTSDSGTASAFPQYTTDRHGIPDGALAFDGTSYVEWSDGSALNALQIGTISMWVKWIGTQDGNQAGSYGAVIARHGDTTGSQQILSLDRADPDNAVVIWKPYGGAEGDIRLTGTTPVGDGVWRHIVVTYRNRRHSLYIDGVLEDTTIFAEGTFLDEPGGEMPMTIGAWTSSENSNTSAVIDDVRIYRGNLTADRVLALKLDSDEDGIPDSFELMHTDGTSTTLLNPDEDLEGDGLTNLEEFENRTDPNKEDSDADGFLDGEEVAFASDPASPNDIPVRSIARVWNEENLQAIRLAFPDPAVHAWNLFHVSVAMWDAWAAYDPVAVGYLFREDATTSDLAEGQRKAITYAAYRILSRKYNAYPHPLTPLESAEASQASFDKVMRQLGYDPNITTTLGSSPEAIGNRIAEAIIAWGASDGSNELQGFSDNTYDPVNPPLELRLPGTTMNDPNRWQPLEFVLQFSQNGQVLESTVQGFLGSHWGDVRPFGLMREFTDEVYLDPGRPPQLGDPDSDDAFKTGNLEVIRFSSYLDPEDGVLIDASPGAMGNNSLGANDGEGHAVNPVTNAPYPPNWVRRADFGRVIAEYWADGPDSETPPGHWNDIANSVIDHPDFERRFGGAGPELEPLEWDVKMYFLINAALHDAAVAAWDCKRAYDFVRPISSIRYMGGLGQSTDPSRSSFHPDGLPLVEGLVEEITLESSSPGQRHSHLSDHVGEIAIYSWGGEPLFPESQFTGTEWIRAVDWLPYQRDTFVTPAFAGFVSGHSTFSRAAAEILTQLTGSAFFPGGMATHTEEPGSLDFEYGPSDTVVLQWATYYDAADQAGISRLYGGIHVPADDGPGRIMGALCGLGAWDLGIPYFDGSILNYLNDMSISVTPQEDLKLEWDQIRGLYYEVQKSTDLIHFFPIGAREQATGDRKTMIVPWDRNNAYYRVVQMP
ncbi:hypothetical protein G0Q06_11875 [Puniceicoccales bacterium CK1056]|uniref:LamG-like jellyroll fold domain-containing protein n=1 Tax=Oceanipulchritudo coccoides TaxID=2706888 RepID=A0A6B2M325_9BACT|nr:LamG-like jellyroll fold domain-containing protein [Oceanipulchritudo coccoides]NDV63153.1 hypothetical protein [Oceanipulchritudo coccoides]